MIEVELIRIGQPTFVYPAEDKEEADEYIKNMMSKDITIDRAKFKLNGKTNLTIRTVNDD